LAGPLKCAGGRRAERVRYTVGLWFFTAKLVIDEYALFKGHRYATVVLDADTRLVLWVGEGTGTIKLLPARILSFRHMATIDRPQL
jgi:hypothetical protein